MSYLKFQEFGDTGKTKLFSVRTVSDDTPLGEIRWFPRWRQYCFFPEELCVFSEGCLGEIAQFIKNLMDVRKGVIK
jgi:hypothetical protein